MTLEKAIEILGDPLTNPLFIPKGDLRDAALLGVEAMKAVHKLRHYPFPDEIFQLPGETKT